MTFLDLLELHGIPCKRPGEHHHVRNGWVGFDCVHCSPNSQRFRAGYDGYKINCWSCGRLDLFETIRELTGEPYEVIRNLDRPVKAPDRPVEASGRLTLPDGLASLKQAHREYLRGRGLDPAEIVNIWGVQAWKWRVFAPIHKDGEIVSFTSRAITPEGAWRHAAPQHENVPIRRTLYGEDYCRDTIIVCEGLGDVWKIGPPATATYGVGYSRGQLLRISQYPRRIILYDSNPEGQKRAKLLLSELAIYPGETINVVLDADDPGSASREEVKEFRRVVLKE